MARNEAVGKARYELETDPTKLKKGLDDAGKRIKQTGAETEKAFAQQGTGAVSKFNKSVDGVVGRFNDLSKRGGLVGAIVGGAGLGVGLSAFSLVSGAVSGVMDKVGRSIDLASDKAEAGSKANILFGDSYGIVERASRTAASTVAMSSGAYLTAAGNVGNLVTNMGVAGDAAARMSVDLIQLAADMGSFNNASPEEVIEAIGAAFRGETEPIRAYGVMLSAAKVEQQALAMGLKDGKKPLTDYAKAMATYQLILGQTGAAQGDLARTADGLANKQRLAAARQEEALTRLGEAIVPLATELVPALADASTAAVEALSALVGGVRSLWAVVGDVNEFFKPWEKEARLAREQVAAWADELERMPEAAGQTRAALEGIAERARAAGSGLEGAKEELIDLARWTTAIAMSGNQLPGMLRNFENWTQLLEAGTITVDQFNAKVRAMTRAGLGELRDNLDLLPPALRDVVLAIDSGQDAVDRFVAAWREASTAAIRTGDWETFSAFLVANADLVREHFEQLPADVQKAMLAAGIVARQELGDWAGTIAQVYQTQLVNSMQGFWTGAGAEALIPPPAVARAIGPENPRGVSAALRRTTDQMFRTMNDAKEPWRSSWKELAEWAKNPFRPDAFERWLEKRADKAIANAKKAAEDGKPGVARRWRAIAAALRDPVIQALTEINGSVAESMGILKLFKQQTAFIGNILPTITSVFGNDGPGNNAAGTASWGGGWTWVGERGPELMRLPQGTEIKSNPESMRMASQLSGRIEVVVRDADGGLARAGIGAADLASRLGAVIASPEQSYRRFEH